MKLDKQNRLWVGLTLGIIAPVIVMLIIYSANYSHMSVNDYLTFLKKNKIFTQVVSICVVPNLGVFFLFIRRNFLMSARGVIAATILYLILIIIFKVS